MSYPESIDQRSEPTLVDQLVYCLPRRNTRWEPVLHCRWQAGNRGRPPIAARNERGTWHIE